MEKDGLTDAIVLDAIAEELKKMGVAPISRGVGRRENGNFMRGDPDKQELLRVRGFDVSAHVHLEPEWEGSKWRPVQSGRTVVTVHGGERRVRFPPRKDGKRSYDKMAAAIDDLSRHLLKEAKEKAIRDHNMVQATAVDEAIGGARRTKDDWWVANGVRLFVTPTSSDEPGKEVKVEVSFSLVTDAGNAAAVLYALRAAIDRARKE